MIPIVMEYTKCSGHIKEKKLSNYSPTLPAQRSKASSYEAVVYSETFLNHIYKS